MRLPRLFVEAPKPVPAHNQGFFSADQRNTCCGSLTNAFTFPTFSSMKQAENIERKPRKRRERVPGDMGGAGNMGVDPGFGDGGFGFGF